MRPTIPFIFLTERSDAFGPRTIEHRGVAGFVSKSDLTALPTVVRSAIDEHTGHAAQHHGERRRSELHNDAHSAAATAFRDKLQPLMIGGFGVRPHGGLSVAASKPQIPSEAIYVVTHVDVFPVHKDAAIELVKTQADTARKDDGNLRFDVLQWDGHPNHFTLVEVWRDRKAFDASATAAHAKDFRQKLTPLEGALYDERLYQTVR